MNEQITAARNRLVKLQKKLRNLEETATPVVLDAGTTLERTVPSHEVGFVRKQIIDLENGIAKLEAEAAKAAQQ